MSTPNNFDRVLQTWLTEVAPSSAPTGLHAQTMDLARQRRQRLAWTAALRDGLAVRPSDRISLVVRIAAVTMLTVVLGVFFFAGIGRQPPSLLPVPTPSGLSPTPSRSPSPSPSPAPSPSLAPTPTVAPSVPNTLAPTSAQPIPGNSPRPLGRNGLIAYSLWDDDHRPYTHVHLMNSDGTDDHEMAQADGVSFAADGQSMGYSVGYGLGERFQRLFVADGDGTNARDVAAYLEFGFDYAPDGSQFVVIESNALWLVAADDGSRTLLVPAPDSPATRVWDVTWSPSSREIAYSVMEEVTSADNSGFKRVAIDIVDVETQVVRRLTSRVGTDATGISWSPDGTRLAYLGNPDGSPEPSLGTDPGGGDAWWQPEDVFVINADGTGERNVTNTESYELEPEWSPTGTSVAFQTFVDPDYRLAIVDVSDPSSEMLIGPATQEHEWSPDAQQLLLSHVEVGNLPGGQGQSFTTTITIIDAGFQTEEQTLLEVDKNVSSLAWQWLAPE